MSKKKGFTLVELMIVISIIGLLSVVLVPRIVSSKDAAKETGVMNNIKTVQNEAALLIDKFPATDQGRFDFGVALATKLGSNVVNPYTQRTEITAWDQVPNWNQPGAVLIHARIGAGNNWLDYNWADNNANGLIGKVFVVARVASGRLECHIWGFDGAAKKLTQAPIVLK